MHAQIVVMSRPPHAAPSRENSVGATSLALAALGFSTLEAAHWAWGGEGLLWTLGRAGFEAALIGGVADWFAVTALFRPVPLGRCALPHTDIIVRNRTKLTEGVVGFVEKQLLSPASVREKLRDFSLSCVLNEQLDSPEGRQLAASTLTLLAGHAAAELEDAKLRGFLTELLRDQIKVMPLAPLFASWLEARVKAGDTRVLWQSVAATLVEQAKRGDFDRLLQDLVRTAVDAYKKEQTGAFGWLKNIAISGVFNPESESRTLRDALIKVLRAVNEEAVHPLARRLDAAVSSYVASLRAGDGVAVQFVRDVQDRLAAHPDLETVVGHLLADLRRLTETKLREAPADFEKALSDLMERGLAKLRADAEAKSRLDHWARESLGSIVTRHHGVIGATARESLNRLADHDLVEQIESKVGHDLQYIRLNGAIVGALVGITIAATRWLLS